MTATETRNASVEIRNLDLFFGAAVVLKNLDLDIYEGEFLVLLGSPGCGKPTLVNCIVGLLEPTAGQIHIAGTSVTWAEPSERGIGRVFQSYALYPQMTVEKTSPLACATPRCPRLRSKNAWRAPRVSCNSKSCCTASRPPSPAVSASPSPSAAHWRETQVFLFDGPLSNLDAKQRADLRVEIKKLREKLGNTMIYVTHDQIEAMTLADRIAIMKAPRSCSSPARMRSTTAPAPFTWPISSARRRRISCTAS